eukprot:scaffold25568_cov78-Attheya_sp.AAC.3
MIVTESREHQKYVTSPNPAAFGFKNRVSIFSSSANIWAAKYRYRYVPSCFYVEKTFFFVVVVSRIVEWEACASSRQSWLVISEVIRLDVIRPYGTTAGHFVFSLVKNSLLNKSPQLNQEREEEEFRCLSNVECLDILSTNSFVFSSFLFFHSSFWSPSIALLFLSRRGWCVMLRLNNDKSAFQIHFYRRNQISVATKLNYAMSRRRNTTRGLLAVYSRSTRGLLVKISCSTRPVDVDIVFSKKVFL